MSRQQEQDRLRDDSLDELRQKIEAGIASLDRGEGISADALFEEIEQHLDDREAIPRP